MAPTEAGEPAWQRVLAQAPVVVLMGTLLRLVDHQAQKITASLVDELEELAVLERILQAPRARPGIDRFDPLLRAPWRCPPLPWGSRFVSRFEASAFYAALDETALLSEAAYYRLIFLAGMEAPFRDRVLSQHTRFEARYHAVRGVRLERDPFSDYESTLRHRADYPPCQRLGSLLREHQIGAFTYLSARSSGRHLNIALLHPDCLVSNRHRRPLDGLCETRQEGVQFRFGDAHHWFAREQFLVEGELPLPAP